MTSADGDDNDFWQTSADFSNAQYLQLVPAWRTRTTEKDREPRERERVSRESLQKTVSRDSIERESCRECKRANERHAGVLSETATVTIDIFSLTVDCNMGYELEGH